MVHIELQGVTVGYPVIVSSRQRSAFGSAAHALGFGRLGQAGRGGDKVMALEGVSLSIPAGARIGLIGRNGSGKSTLLRTMAGIIPPSYGQVRVSGEVACVLTLGTGLDPDATGFDNLYILGRLLGFRGKQLEALVHDAVEFAELGGFMGLPVRTYSSGMMARLCFAAATAQRSDILLIDEVIATGDMHFAAKAIERVRRLCASSGIVVLATHGYEVLSGFCTDAIWMDSGRVRAVGPVDEVWRRYAADEDRLRLVETGQARGAA